MDRGLLRGETGAVSDSHRRSLRGGHDGDGDGGFRQGAFNTVSSGKSEWKDLVPSGVILVLVPTELFSAEDEDGNANPVTVGDGDGASATPSPLLRRPPCPALPPNDEPGVIMLLPLPVSDGDDDSTPNPADLAPGDADRTSTWVECAAGLADCLAAGTPRLELTAP